MQEEEEAEEEEEASKDAQALRDSIASIKWLREREGGDWPGSSSADPIRQQKLQQMASIKKWVMGCLWDAWSGRLNWMACCANAALMLTLQCSRDADYHAMLSLASSFHGVPPLWLKLQSPLCPHPYPYPAPTLPLQECVDGGPAAV